MKIKLVQHVSQNRGKPHAYVRCIIDWPDGLSMPHEGDFLTLAEDDEDTVRDVQFTPLGETKATIVLIEGLAEDPETAQEWAARRRPGWDAF